MKKTLYHGTDNAESIVQNGFDISEVSLYGSGFYFLEKKTDAKLYGDEIVSADVIISKPITFKGESGKLFERLRKKHKNKFSSFPSKDAIEEMRDKFGYDSASFDDCSRSGSCPKAWVIFRKQRIRNIRRVA